jgi:hypothetical protein
MAGQIGIWDAGLVAIKYLRFLEPRVLNTLSNISPGLLNGRPKRDFVHFTGEIGI